VCAEPTFKQLGDVSLKESFKQKTNKQNTFLNQRTISSSILLLYDKEELTFVWRENILGYLSGDMICAGMRTVLLRSEEQIIYKDKYPCVFLRQMEANVFRILQMFFFATRAVEKIGKYHLFLSFSCGIFRSLHAFSPIATSETI